MYQGIYLCENLCQSLLLHTLPDFHLLTSQIAFSGYTFKDFSEHKNLTIPNAYHIALVEVREADTGESWFSLLKSLLLSSPHCRIIFIIEHSLENCSQYLNQIPFTYLLPASQISILLETALDKALSELAFIKNYYGNDKDLSGPASRYANAVFLSTDGLVHKGKKGCIINYPDQKSEYCRTSMRHLMAALPENFIQIHKSYVVNMNYCDTIISRSRPTGSQQDQFILLKTLPRDMSAVSSQDMPRELPVGPKYEINVQKFLLNKYAHPYFKIDRR